MKTSPTKTFASSSMSRSWRSRPGIGRNSVASSRTWSAPVPADGRLLDTRDFFVSQALLTGEPYPVEKTAARLAHIKCDMLGLHATKNVAWKAIMSL